MAKIKENIDLKKLEKHLVKLNIMDGDDIYVNSDNEPCINVYCLIDEDEKEYIENNCIADYFVQFYIDNNREIAYCTYPEQRNEELIINKIIDMTLDNLLEK